MGGRLKYSEIMIDYNVNQSASYIKTIFASSSAFFDQHIGYQRIASFYGINGTGLNVNELGDMAWVVYRAVSTSVVTGAPLPARNVPPFEFAITMNYESNPATNVSGVWQFTTASGTTLTNRIGVYYSLAYHSSGIAWSGSVNNDGQDSFDGITPWKTGSFVFPRQNGLSASAETTRNYCAPMHILNTLNPTYQIFFIADNDSILIPSNAVVGPTNSACRQISMWGAYIPFNSYIDLPLFCYSVIDQTNDNLMGIETFIGDLDNQSVNFGGTQWGGINFTSESALWYPQSAAPGSGVVWNPGSWTYRTGQVYYEEIMETARFNIVDGNAFEFPVSLLLDDATAGGYQGNLGYLPFVRWINSAVIKFDRTDKRLVMEQDTASPMMFTIPYTGNLFLSGASAPESGSVYSSFTDLFVLSGGKTNDVIYYKARNAGDTAWVYWNSLETAPTTSSATYIISKIKKET